MPPTWKAPALTFVFTFSLSSFAGGDAFFSAGVFDLVIIASPWILLVNSCHNTDRRALLATCAAFDSGRGNSESGGEIKTYSGSAMHILAALDGPFSLK